MLVQFALSVVAMALRFLYFLACLLSLLLHLNPESLQVLSRGRGQRLVLTAKSRRNKDRKKQNQISRWFELWSFSCSQEQLLLTVLRYLLVDLLQSPLLLPSGLLQLAHALLERLLVSLGSLQLGAQLALLLAQPGRFPLGLVQLRSRRPHLGVEGQLRLGALGGFGLQLSLGTTCKR